MEEASYLPVIPALTAVVAAPFVGKLIDIVGRRPALLSVTLSYTLSWSLVATAGGLSPDSAPLPFGIYCGSRVLDGIGDACFFSTVPCYVTEIATPRVRGTWGNCIALLIFVGQFLMNILGAYLSISNAAYASLMLPALFLVNYFFLKESPYYLIMRKRMDAARASLQWLRGTSDVEEELAALTSDVERQLSERGRYIDLVKIPSNRRACLVGILLRAAQQFSGIAAFGVFAQTIFIESGSDLSARMSAIVYSGILFMCIFLACFFVNHLGRRTAMLISCIGTSGVLFAQSAFYFIQHETEISTNHFSFFPLVSLLVFVAFYCIGLGMLPTLMLGELFSSSVKGRAFVVMNICFGLFYAASAKIFAVCIGYVGMYAGFLFFAVCSAVSSVLSYYFIPETRGKTLEEIQQGFKTPDLQT